MKIKILIISIITLSFCGCQRILLSIYGVDAKPKAKSNEEILRYIEENNLPIENQYTINNYGFEIINKISNSFNSFILFDEQGNLLTDSSKNACLENKIDKIEYMLQNKYLRKDTTIKLQNIQKHIVNNTKTEKNDFLKEKHKYFLVLTWATYAGKFNKSKYLQWHNKVSTYSQKYDIEIYSISLDFLKNVNYDNINYKPK